MNGPDHYQEAEEALHYAFSGESEDPASTIAAAQVHATLALAAVTAAAFAPDPEAWTPALTARAVTR